MSMEAFQQTANDHAKALNRMYYEKEQEVVKLRRHKFRLTQEKEELIKERDKAVKDLESAMKGQEWLQEKCKEWEQYCDGLKGQIKRLKKREDCFNASIAKVSKHPILCPGTETYAALDFEFNRARTYPPFHSAHEALGVIAEEFAEVQECIFKNEPLDLLHEELLQVAACCLKAVEDSRGWEEHGPSRTCTDSHGVGDCEGCGCCKGNAA